LLTYIRGHPTFDMVTLSGRLPIDLGTHYPGYIGKKLSKLIIQDLIASFRCSWKDA